MSTPRSASRRKKTADNPPSTLAPILRDVELIGVDEDGNMSLWQRGDVQPITEFGGDGHWIESAHYVIEWKGHAITVQCRGSRYGSICVLFMCGGGYSVQMPFAEVEAMLLGKVIPDPEHEARIHMALESLLEAMRASNAAPHLRRGRI